MSFKRTGKAPILGVVEKQAQKCTGCPAHCTQQHAAAEKEPPCSHCLVHCGAK